MTSMDIVTPLIHRHLTNQLGAEDSSRLQEWLKEKQEHWDYFNQIKQIWELAKEDEPEEIADEELNEELKKFENTIAGSISEERRTQRNRIRYVIFVVISCTLLIASSLLAYNYYAQNNELRNKNTTITKESEVSIRATNLTSFVLGDSIDVILNHSAALEVTNQDRAGFIQLQGKAYFHSRTSNAILVRIGTLEVKGTHFIATHIPRTEVQIIPLSGGLTVKANDDIRKVAVGEKFIFNANTSKVQIENNEDLNFNSWYTHKLIFKNTIMQDVFAQLQNHYNIRFNVEKTKILECHFTGSFQDIALDDMLKIIAYAMKVEFVRDGNAAFMVKGNGACNE